MNQAQLGSLLSEYLSYVFMCPYAHRGSLFLQRNGKLIAFNLKCIRFKNTTLPMLFYLLQAQINKPDIGVHC